MDPNISFFDVEDRVDNFIIRKKQHDIQTTDSAKSGPKIHEDIPLTIAHILRATQDPETPDVFITYNANTNSDPIHFRTCIVYAFVSGYGTHNTAFNKYHIDDSTGFLEASISKGQAKKQIVACLHAEATSLASSERYKPIAQSLIRLLGAATEYIDPGAITRGHSLFLRGRPTLFRGKMGLDAYSFLIDSGSSRKQEIAFADHLLSWHHDYKSTTQVATNK
ncbi:uncharacterized protein ver [Drosophila kikkawai]|uniref:Uncharacterized protein ver n=1 Tax=Drosophila kikkawai TaxID=30033 RepID=A0A6P4I1E4_DROKI|nr:uncharacterized protein LOC108070490 [Drosophila kikkawai]